MKQFFMRPYRYGIFFSLILIGAMVFTVLDAFVIPKTMVAQQTTAENTTVAGQLAAATENTQIAQSSDANITDSTYKDENIKISIQTIRQYDTDIYIADIQVSDPSYLKTALAENTYGRNVKETTSAMAEEHQAILAINGDYYGFRNYGYVLRNGILYRDTEDQGNDALVIDENGDFSILSESDTALASLDLDQIWQILSFGPSLIEEGMIQVDESSEVSQSKTSNPRTAIGQVSALHYVIVVSDGRTSQSAGLSLLELAQVMKEQGCTTAYNLDGGGSSTLYFNGKVINTPTDGRSNGERKVSDIVYIGY